MKVNFKYVCRCFSRTSIDISPEVKAALNHRKPVIALESALITHGLPYPKNVETAMEMEHIIRSHVSSQYNKFYNVLFKNRSKYLFRQTHRCVFRTSHRQQSAYLMAGSKPAWILNKSMCSARRLKTTQSRFREEIFLMC